jgi:hypothetical protein
MVFVNGTIGFPDGEDKMEELAHAIADGDIAAFALGPQATIEGADGRVVTNSGPSGTPQIGAQQIVAFARHAPRARRQWVAELVDAGAVFFGKNAELADQILGRAEAA